MADERAPQRGLQRRPSLVGVLLLASLLVAGCRHLPAPFRSRAVSDCPGPLVATDAIIGDFLVRQSVRITTGEGHWSLQLVVQKRGDELTLLGFHPLGAKLFTLQQRGDRIVVDAAPPPLLEIPPRNLLRDLHRERFLAVAATGADGAFRERRGDVAILEVRNAGRVIERRFEAIDGEPPRVVTLHFDPVADPADGAPRVRIENDGCGYRAEIRTLSATRTP